MLSPEVLLQPCAAGRELSQKPGFTPDDGLDWSTPCSAPITNVLAVGPRRDDIERYLTLCDAHLVGLRWMMSDGSLGML